MTKKVFIYCICLVTVLVGLVGCSNKRTNTSTPDVSSATTDTTISTDAGDKTTVGDLGTTTTINKNTATTITNTPVPAKTTTAHSASVTTKKPVAKTTNKHTPTTTQKPTSQWDLPAQGNEELLKQRIIYYVNEYRVKEGKTKVISNQTPAMQRFADLRAIDITTNFSHDTNMASASAQKAKFGQLIDEGYYDAATGKITYTGKKIYATVGGEAIGFDGTTNSIEYMAKNIAEGYYSSKNHWAYLGSNEYSYMVAGVKYYNGTKGTGWYTVLVCCQEDKVQYAK